MIEFSQELIFTETKNQKFCRVLKFLQYLKTKETAVDI